jgi:hypothetical protein
MGTYYCGTILDREQVGGNRTSDATIGRRCCNRADETLARGANQKRQTEGFEGIKSRKTDDALLRSFSKTYSRIEHDALARNTCARGNLQ